MAKSVPIIDISPLLAKSAGEKQVAKDLHEACKTYGFFYITGHGVSEELQTELLLWLLV